MHHCVEAAHSDCSNEENENRLNIDELVSTEAANSMYCEMKMILNMSDPIENPDNRNDMELIESLMMHHSDIDAAINSFG